MSHRAPLAFSAVLLPLKKNVSAVRTLKVISKPCFVKHEAPSLVFAQPGPIVKTPLLSRFVGRGTTVTPGLSKRLCVLRDHSAQLQAPRCHAFPAATVPWVVPGEIHLAVRGRTAKRQLYKLTARKGKDTTVRHEGIFILPFIV
jgi:hypothetical protein